MDVVGFISVFRIEPFSTVVSGTAPFELCDAGRGFEMTAGMRLAGKGGDMRGWLLGKVC